MMMKNNYRIKYSRFFGYSIQEKWFWFLWFDCYYCDTYEEAKQYLETFQDFGTLI
jgi:hypothetical protein